MAEHTLAILVKAVGTAQAAKKLKGVDAVVSNIGAHAGKGLRTAGDNLARIGVIGAGLAAAGIVASVKAAADFEAQLRTVNTVAKVTDQQLQAIGGDIRKVARDTGADINDLATAYYDLVSAGIKPGAEALNVLRLANTLAIGGLATTGQTVDLLTTAINTYHLSASGAARATDQFAEAIALGKVTAAEIATSFAQVGPIAQAMGVGIDEIAASYAALTAKGIPAAEAATNMRAALVALSKPTSALNKAQKDLGVNFANIARKKGLQVAMAKIVKYSKDTGVPLAKLLGRIEGVQYALSTTGKNADDYNSALKNVQNATGTAADQMSERQQGLNYELGRLKALAIDAGISLGTKLLPKLTPLVEKAVAFLDTHQSDIDAFGDGIASAFDRAIQFAERIPWGTIGTGLKTAADWAERLMGVFASVPPEMQTTLIALAGLNKLSGGAISGIVGELGKGLIKGVLGMTAGVVNINAAVVNGGGKPGIGTGSGGGGLSGTLANIPLVGATVANMNDMRPDVPWQFVVRHRFDRQGADEAPRERDFRGGEIKALGRELERARKSGDSAQVRVLTEKLEAIRAGLRKVDPKNPTGDTTMAFKDALQPLAGDTRSEGVMTRKAIDGVATGQAESLIAFRAGERATQSAGVLTAASASRAGTTAAIASLAGASRIVSAVASIRPTVNVYVSVPGASVRYGSGSSRDRGTGRGV